MALFQFGEPDFPLLPGLVQIVETANAMQAEQKLDGSGRVPARTASIPTRASRREKAPYMVGR
ncbi:MAG: hypothetical protein OXP68_07120 [Anaerolineaceae bacterium]|nr:hypothetical protein [Anaerolineaceae bacterium]MDE0328530.1 hypothetical protein [Anaerolineaceae bacterium]